MAKLAGTGTGGKAARIRTLAARGWARKTIARHLGCSLDYVHVQLWKVKNPGYNADWMRRKREEDLDFRERERRWQERYNLERIQQRATT